jgi:hypothetical protein
MPTTVHPTWASARIAHRALTEAIAGVIGGVAFGILMAAMGMLPMVGMLIGVNDPGVGYAVHLVNSAIIGVAFSLLTGPLAARIGPLLAAGIGYGVLWWVLGALLIMPLWLSLTADPAVRGMIFHVGAGQWLSLIGHLIYGLIAVGELYGLRRGSAR